MERLLTFRLIKAGGGTVVEELTSENMKTLTHVITENRYYNLIEVNMLYIYNYLIIIIV